MYTVSAAFSSAIKSSVRKIRAKLVYGDTTLYPSDGVESVKISCTLASQNKLIGNAAAAKCVIVTKNCATSFAKGDTVTPYIGCVTAGNTVEYVPYAPVTVYKIERSGLSKTYTCYDAMYALESLPVPSVPSDSYNTNTLLTAVLSGSGVGNAGVRTDITSLWNPYGITKAKNVREAVAYIAAWCCCNAYVDRSGNVAFKSLYKSASSNVDSYAVAAKNCFSPITDTGAMLPIGSVHTQAYGGATYNTLYDYYIGSTGSILTQKNEPVYDAVKNVLWTTLLTDDLQTFAARYTEGYNGYNGLLDAAAYELPWHGNPALDPGDELVVSDKDGTTHTVRLFDCETTYSGGLRMDCSSGEDYYDNSDVQTSIDDTSDEVSNDNIAASTVTGDYSGTGGGTSSAISNLGFKPSMIIIIRVYPGSSTSNKICIIIGDSGIVVGSATNGYCYGSRSDKGYSFTGGSDDDTHMNASSGYYKYFAFKEMST